MLDGQATGFLWGIVIVCVIGLLIIIPVLISKTKTAVNNTQKMEGVGPSIKNLSKKQKQNLMNLVLLNQTIIRPLDTNFLNTKQNTIMKTIFTW